jgi:hypothetical protein
MTTLRKGQVRLGPRTWALIREAYLNGASGASLAEAYGCSVGTIRYRAVREGWRRCDVNGAAEPGAPPAPEEAEAASPGEMMRQALAAAARAVATGRPSQAAAYLRVVEALGRIAGPGEERKADEPPQMSEEEVAARHKALEERVKRLMTLIAAKRAAATRRD